MKIEILFSEMGIYYGDYGNIVYLTKCLPEAQFIYTDNLSRPAFLDEKVDLVYLGSLSENKQKLAIERLLPYRDAIKEKIEEGVFSFLPAMRSRYWAIIFRMMREKPRLLAFLIFTADAASQDALIIL